MTMGMYSCDSWLQYHLLNLVTVFILRKVGVCLLISYA